MSKNPVFSLLTHIWLVPFALPILTFGAVVCSAAVGCLLGLQDHEALEESLDLAERQPLFLKDKADGMHRAGNYRAAVNAYTKAIQLDMGMTVCYSNRAASYLKLKEFRQAYRRCMLDHSSCQTVCGS